MQARDSLVAAIGRRFGKSGNDVRICHIKQHLIAIGSLGNCKVKNLK